MQSSLVLLVVAVSVGCLAKDDLCISLKRVSDTGIDSSDTYPNELGYIKEQIRLLSKQIQYANSRLSDHHDHIGTQPDTRHGEDLNKKFFGEGGRSCGGGERFGKQCFKLAYFTGPRVNYEEAKSRCRKMSAEIAEISSDAMYETVSKYLKESWKGYTDRHWDFVNVWLAQTYEPENNPKNLVTLKNGTKMEWHHWYPGYPFTGKRYSGRKRLIMSVRTGDRGDSGDAGVFNYIDSLKEPVPLCSYWL